MENGHIRMAKTWLDQGLLKDARLWTVWSFCLLNARHQPGIQTIRGKRVEVCEGEFVTTSKDMARDLDIQRSTLRSLLRRLKEQERIKTRSEGTHTLIRICNWDRFVKDGDAITASGGK